MLFGETVAVYCENHTEHTDTVRTSQETHYVQTRSVTLVSTYQTTNYRRDNLSVNGRGAYEGVAQCSGLQ
jgi:hypothetical protein